MKAVTNPNYAIARVMSISILPQKPQAAKPMSVYDLAQLLFLASMSFKAQTAVSIKLRTIAKREKNQPPFKKFLGTKRMPVHIKPFRSMKYVLTRPIFSDLKLSCSSIKRYLVLGVALFNISLII